MSHIGEFQEATAKVAINTMPATGYDLLTWTG